MLKICFYRVENKNILNFCLRAELLIKTSSPSLVAALMAAFFCFKIWVKNPKINLNHQKIAKTKGFRGLKTKNQVKSLSFK